VPLFSAQCSSLTLKRAFAKLQATSLRPRERRRPGYVPDGIDELAIGKIGRRPAGTSATKD